MQRDVLWRPEGWDFLFKESWSLQSAIVMAVTLYLVDLNPKEKRLLSATLVPRD